MALVLRRLGRVELARTFHRDIRNSNDYFHFAIGRTEAWTDDTSPETPIDNDSYVSKFRRSMMFTQRIDSADVCLLAKRNDWSSGTVYDEYDDNISSTNQTNSGASNLADATFFIMTDEFKVYKCISNNNNGPSTVKPTSTGTSVFELGDNYNWKFMFQISASDQNKFLDADFVPVRKLTGNPTHDVTGEVDSVTITAGGSSYTSAPTVVIQGDGDGLAAGTATIDTNPASGTYQQVTGVTITASGSGYSFAFITFTGGGGSGATGSVNLGDADSLPALQSAVEGAAVSGTLDRVIVTSAGQDYAESDVQVTVEGDGTGAEASAYVNAATGAITKIRVTNPGSGYSYVDVKITNTAAPGTGATARGIVSPQGGHGSNAPRELFATNLGVTVSLSDNDNRDLILGNDFRQISLIKNIKTPAGVVYTTNTATACFIINVSSSALSSYAVDDNITTDDGGTFTVIQIDSENNNVYLTSTNPIMTTNSVLTNTTKNITNLVINSITNPEVDNATGEIIYLDNRSPVTRSVDQVEQIKALIRF